MKQKLYFLTILLSGFMPLFSMEYSAEQVKLVEEFRKFVETERELRWFNQRVAKYLFNPEQFKADCARKALERQAASESQPVAPAPAKTKQKPNLTIKTSGPSFDMGSEQLPQRYAPMQALPVQALPDDQDPFVDIPEFDLGCLGNTPKPTNTQHDKAQPAGMLCRTDKRKPTNFKDKIRNLYVSLPPLEQRSTSSLSGRITGISTVQGPTPFDESTVTPVMVGSPMVESPK